MRWWGMHKGSMRNAWGSYEEWMENHMRLTWGQDQLNGVRRISAGCEEGTAGQFSMFNCSSVFKSLSSVEEPSSFFCPTMRKCEEDMREARYFLFPPRTMIRRSPGAQFCEQTTLPSVLPTPIIQNENRGYCGYWFYVQIGLGAYWFDLRLHRYDDASVLFDLFSSISVPWLFSRCSCLVH